jgi:mycothiol synthase
MNTQIAEENQVMDPEEATMDTKNKRTETIDVPDAPAIAGLVFRHFRGDDDFSAMAEIITASTEEDQLELAETADDIARDYRHLTNSNPAKDMLFAEVDGEAIGYSRMFWQQVDDGPRLYFQFAYLKPAWRGKGVRRAMLRHCERHNRAIAADHDVACPKVLDAYAGDTETDWVRVLEEEGFKPIRFSFQLVRENLDGIPDLPLPDGLDVREAQPAAHRKIFDAAREAFRDHWGFSADEWNDETLKSWMESDTWQPHLWQVAWDGDEVAGMVLNYIDEKQNRKFGRKRGYTETICVRRPWRRRGLARALIARSLRVHKTQGMTETALGVDAENPNGALQLYQSMGYKTVRRSVAYRKLMNTEPPTIREGP